MKDSTKAQDTGTAWSRAARRGILVTLAIAAGAVSLGLAKPVQADNVKLYATSFEQPIFPLGAQLVGRDGWVAAIPPPFLPAELPFLNPDAAKITGAAASNRKQSVEVYGGDLTNSLINPLDPEGKPVTYPYDAVGSYRRPIGEEIVARQSRVHYDADLLLETDQPATPGQFFSMTISARSGNAKTLGEVGLSSQGIFEGYSFEVDAAPGTEPVVARAPISFNQWYRISMLLDYVNRTTSYYLDGRLVGTANFPPSPVPPETDVLSRVAIVVYALPDGGVAGGSGSLRSNYTARFDNLRVRLNSAGR